MSLPLKDIERPLGLGRSRRRGLGQRINPSRRTLAAVLVVGVGVVASAVIALRPRAFEVPPAAVADAGAPAVAVDGKAEPKPPMTPSAPPGAAVIQVDPSQPGSMTGAIDIHDPAAAGQNLRVAHLPDKALIEESPSGPLPIRAADGRRPFDVYARPWSGARGARVAIVIGGLAVSQTGTQAAIQKLPAEVTLAFASGGNSIGRWMQAARHEGHEIIMQVPLEPFDYPSINPGRNTLTVDAPPEENVDRLHWALSRTTNYTGVMNYMGARFTADGPALDPVMKDLGKRGLLYLDDGQSARSLAEAEAMASGVPFAAADATIDSVRERGDILKKLDELERVARAKGYAVGTGSAFDVTVDAVVAWVGEAKRRGIEIVPISAVATDPERK